MAGASRESAGPAHPALAARSLSSREMSAISRPRRPVRLAAPSRARASASASSERLKSSPSSSSMAGTADLRLNTPSNPRLSMLVKESSISSAPR